MKSSLCRYRDLGLLVSRNPQQDLLSNEQRQAPEAQRNLEEVDLRRTFPKDVPRKHMHHIIFKEGDLLRVLRGHQCCEHLRANQVWDQADFDLSIDDRLPVAPIHPGHVPSWRFPCRLIEAPDFLMSVLCEVTLLRVESPPKLPESAPRCEADAGGKRMPYSLFHLRSHRRVLQQRCSGLGRIPQDLSNVLQGNVLAHIQLISLLCLLAHSLKEVWDALGALPDEDCQGVHRELRSLTKFLLRHLATFAAELEGVRYPVLLRSLKLVLRVVILAASLHDLPYQNDHGNISCLEGDVDRRFSVLIPGEFSFGIKKV
mmetsp:Transcript_50939/g.118683  ORF Transcript_50939/g.118683 Transcript_50939/m.118683 type:complete len:315 (-) Transcript_50939:365-1309(-)